MTDKLMTIYDIANAQSVAASSTYTSSAISLKRGENFGVIVDAVSGTNPNFDISYTVSASESGTYISPDSNVLVNDSETTTAVSFTPVPAPFMKLIITNNNATNALTISAKLVVQEG